MVRVHGIQKFSFPMSKSSEKFAVDSKNIYTFALEMMMLNN